MQTRIKTQIGCGLLLLGFGLTGCLENNLLWSPDGNRAAVIVENSGLYLCDADGKLTSALVPNVYRAAWLGDSQQLVVARERKTGDWPALARLLGPEKSSAVISRAEAVWQKAGKPKSGEWRLDAGQEDDADAILVCLWAHHADELRVCYGEKAKENQANATVTISELVMARIIGDQIQPGTTLYEGRVAVGDIRIAPAGGLVAFTTAMSSSDSREWRLQVVRSDGTGAQQVAERTNLFCDWTADGHTLAYIQALGSSRGKDDIRIGLVVTRDVTDGAGQIKIAENATELARLSFSDEYPSRIRCLRDGQILFNAFEITLPVAQADASIHGQRLFALDPARHATLVRMIPLSAEDKMPGCLSFFEVSPDEKQLLVGGLAGEVCVLTLASGEVENLQNDAEPAFKTVPVWRKTGEITYARRNPPVDGKAPERAFEIVLRKDGQETVLSHGWSKEMLDGVCARHDG
jgi:hypothetical protein